MKKYQKGISFIEAVIYISLLGAVSAFVLNMVFVIGKSYYNLVITRNINAAAASSLERISKEIRLASGIDAAYSVFNAHPGKLFLNTVHQDTGAETALEFYLDNAVLTASSTEGVKYLTSSSTAISNLVFRDINMATTSAVKIEMEIVSSKANFQKSEKFYLTVGMR